MSSLSPLVNLFSRNSLNINLNVFLMFLNALRSYLCLDCTKNTSLLSADKNLEGISSRGNTIIPPPLQFRSNLKGDAIQEF